MPTPYVDELARLQQGGWIDQRRLECAMVVAAPLAEDIRVSSRTVRDIQRQRSAFEGRDHAWSVQRGMAESDEANDAARAAQDARRGARQAALAGNLTRAGHLSSYATRLLDPARDTHGLRQATEAGAERGADLTDDEADLFVEYAELRASLVSGGPTEATVRRIREIESESPAAMDLYAGLLLDLYDAEEALCADGSPT